MLTTIEAEIDIHGNVRLLEPLTLTKTTRVLLTLLDEDTVRPNGTATPKQNGGIRAMFGTWRSGNPHGANTEQIDADLARAYADNYEEES